MNSWYTYSGGSAAAYVFTAVAVILVTTVLTMWRVLSQSGERVLRVASACESVCVRACESVCVGVSAILRDSPSSNMNNNAAPAASDNDCRVSGPWLCPYALLTHVRRSAETVSRIPSRRRGRGVRGPPAPQPWCLCDVQDVAVVVVPGKMSNEKWLTPAIRPTVPAWRIATQTSSPWLVLSYHLVASVLHQYFFKAA